MMNAKVFLLSGLLVLVGASLWAAGRKENNESHEAGDPAALSRPVFINEKKSGKYNYYLEATDTSGNTTLAGPDNMYVDPPSDLPRTTAINPIPNMRVQGNLNIVGVAVDDDGVVGVELTVTRGKDGKGEELVREYAEGADYWYYFLKTTDPDIWTDGVYTITSWATDVNGLSGISEDFPAKVRRQHQVYWNLDRKKPETTVSSHEIGALVSGSVKVRGNVYDGNLIEYLRYSLDGGEKYIPVSLKKMSVEGWYEWSIEINTKKLEDGPRVVLFEAKDKMGSVGGGAHLFFVNNTPPDVEIVYPPADAVVNGVFSIAGFAKHGIGLQSVSWKAGKLGGDFDLLPGNAWWSADVDLRGVKATAVEIEIRAVDVSGNTTVKKQKYKVNQNADIPTVTLSEPLAGSAAKDGRLIVKGVAADDDGVASVFYAIGTGEPVELTCSGNFQFVISNIPEGVHNIDVWARDLTGVTGPKVTVKNISVPGDLPQPRIAAVSAGSGSGRTREFYTGMTLRLEPKVKTAVEITVKAQALTSAAVFFGDLPGAAFKPGGAGKDGLLRATVTVPANLPSGFTKIEITATDRFGREAAYSEYVFIDQADPAIPSSYDAAARWFQWISRGESGGRIVLENSEEVLIGLGSVPLNAARLSGTGAENLTVEIDGYGRANLRARGEGSFGPLTLSLADAGGATYQSHPFNIVVDSSPPEIILRETPSRWLQRTAPVRFTLSSASRIASLDYSLDMGENWQRLVTAAELAELGSPVNTSITRAIDISTVEDGTVNLTIRAVNAAGREAVADFIALKDTVPPEAELIMPVAEASVNGTIRMAFAVREAGALRTITYRRGERMLEVFNADDWENDYSCMFTEVLMDATQMPLFDDMRFVFTDRAGNSSEINSWPFIIDRVMDIPVVQVTLPEENEIVTTDFIVSGIMYDDDKIKQIYWKLDDGAEQVIVAENGFSIPVSLSWLTDNGHTISVVAEDVYGIRSDPAVRGFRVSLSEPEAAVIYPRFDSVLRDAIEITGTAHDENGIKGLNISIDNGTTFNPVFGTEQWNYKFNTKILKDGPHVVFYRVWDMYDIPATYAAMVNVDNTPPEILLDSPEDGAVSVGKVSVMGRVIDPNLSSITMEFRPLTGSPVRADLRSQEIEIDFFLKQELDLTGQADGIYNLAIVAVDEAGNTTKLSRNIELARESKKNFVEVYYPLDNENVQGSFNLYGFAGGRDTPETVTVRINGIDRVINKVDKTGYYRFPLDSEFMTAGLNKIEVHSNFGGTEPVMSRAYTIYYTPEGPWVTIDSFNFGDFAYDRPYLTGRFGYVLSEEDAELLAAEETDKEVKTALKTKVPAFTELSFDNGKTFVKASRALFDKSIDYRYRLETGEMTEGLHYIIAKSTMKNGEIAVTRMIVQVDKTPPVIRLISPEPGFHYNQEISYSASATDDQELEGLTYHLRIGDKALYGVPGFLQGLYFEGVIPPFLKQAWNNLPSLFGGGATYTDFGMGLSFFDDNVKIQAQYGFLTQKLYDKLGGDGMVRYGGSVFGVKVLANIYALPFGPIIGPDWEWLSATFALGANFSLFNIGNEENPEYSPNASGDKVYYTQSGAATWMGALLLQVEFPKVTIPKRKNFRTFSLFTEGQLWFVPTDVDADAYGIPVVIPHVIMGLRMYIF